MTKGGAEGGGQKSQKNYDVFYERPPIVIAIFYWMEEWNVMKTGIELDFIKKHLATQQILNKLPRPFVHICISRT